MTVAEDMAKQGYALVKGVFDQAYMDAMEPALGSDPAFAIRRFMGHAAVQDIAHELAGRTLGVTGEESVNFEPTTVYDAWHYDVPWRPLEGNTIPIWRFAVYFRDYTTHSGGLQVVPGSHLGSIGSLHRTPRHILSQPGDLVIWNLRTLHAAGGKNGDLPYATPRNAVFFDYGIPGPEIDRYVKWRKEKRDREALLDR